MRAPVAVEMRERLTIGKSSAYRRERKGSISSRQCSLVGLVTMADRGLEVSSLCLHEYAQSCLPSLARPRLCEYRYLGMDFRRAVQTCTRGLVSMQYADVGRETEWSTVVGRVTGRGLEL